ncbi:hypothetical protein FVER53590_04887 [Fusarium verticillioides]|nr:hypothetical protein FVER14953_04887 [Fusarium verticillioides]RBQ85451.1 hypothetical protein FVER53263_04887 [Fusarium verticillioides]RBR03762.1 hypothetical protein FVER53590_04887 [Fusarium verticillioides]
MDPQEENLIRQSIGAPKIDVLPGQQEQSNLPTGPSTEMQENRSQAEIIKQKTAEIPPAVGNADDPDAITPAEASTSFVLPKIDNQPPIEFPTTGETGRSDVGAASTNGVVGNKNRTNPTATIDIEPRSLVHKAASVPDLGSINRKTNVDPGGDMTEKKPETVDIFPDPPKDDPKKSAEEVAQPMAA